MVSDPVSKPVALRTCQMIGCNLALNLRVVDRPSLPCLLFRRILRFTVGDVVASSRRFSGFR